MTQYVFMNEKIRQKKPCGPVIVVQDGAGAQYEANAFDLIFEGVLIGRVRYDRAGLDACETHEVKAWVELADGVEAVRSSDFPATNALGCSVMVRVGEQRPVASEKKPNQPVQFFLKIPK
jgi:hypothetical protein